MAGRCCAAAGLAVEGAEGEELTRWGGEGGARERRAQVRGEHAEHVDMPSGAAGKLQLDPLGESARPERARSRRELMRKGSEQGRAFYAAQARYVTSRRAVHE